MGGLVHQDAAAFAAPGGPPGTGVIIGLCTIPVRYGPGTFFDFPEFPGSNDFPGPDKQGIGPLVEHDGKHLIAFPCFFSKPEPGGKADIHRLFG